MPAHSPSFPSLNILALLLLFAALSGCKKDSPAEMDMGYRYFPVNPGHWVLYQVDSIAWDDFDGSIDTFSFQIKEHFESVFMDDQGRENIRIERYKRISDTSDWFIKDVWFGLRTEATAERVEENKRYIKMIFPIKDGVEWNGNAFNTLESLDYTYVDIHQPWQLGSFFADSTALVLQDDYTTQISRDYAVERYAAGIGLVYKKHIQQEKLPTGLITHGFDYSYTLVAWGDE